MPVKKSKSTAKPQPAKAKIGSEVLVAVLLDRSGSMSSVQGSTIEGFNSYLDELKEKSETSYFVTATLFDSNVSQLDLSVLCVNTPLAKAPRLDTGNYIPRGSTPLYDAIGRTIRSTEAEAAGRPVVMMIVTDGHENASHEFTPDTIKALIAEKEKQGWTFVFMGANIDSYAVGRTIGIHTKNIANYAPGAEVMAFATASAGTKGYAAMRCATQTVGQLASEGFFDHLPKDSQGQASITNMPDPMVTTTTAGHRPFVTHSSGKVEPAPTGSNRQHRPL